jgi:hypothetical protein
MSGKTYAADKPCRKGHPAIRYVCSKECVQCVSDQRKRQYYSRLEYHKQRNKDHKRHNRARYTSAENRRRAQLIKATPKWLTDHHIEQIELLYEIAGALSSVRGEKAHVDHICPLKGKDCCGLHVPWNLQVIPAVANWKKGNRF